MFNNKKSGFMRHPYAMLTVIGLATAGALAVGSKVKSLVGDKAKQMTGVMKNMKDEFMG